MINKRYLTSAKVRDSQSSYFLSFWGLCPLVGCSLVPHQGFALDTLGLLTASLRPPDNFFHLRPYTKLIWNTKTVLWQRAWKNP